MIPAGFVVAAVMIATLAGVLLGYWLRGAAVESHVETAAVGDGPVGRPVEREGWTPNPPPSMPEMQAPPAAPLSEYRWWLSPSDCVHLPGCKQMRAGQPWVWPDDVDHATQLAKEHGYRVCRHCHPFAVARADTGELEAVSS